jgi:hypothetical protein
MVTYYESQNGRVPAHLLQQLADVLKVNIDELVGHQRRNEETKPRNPRLWLVEKLREADRKAVLRFVDALLPKRCLDHQRG